MRDGLPSGRNRAMAHRVHIFLQPPGDTLARPIGTKEVSPLPVEGGRVHFQHNGHLVAGAVRAVDPPDWQGRGVVPTIVVKMSPVP
jgi:hypothetical protein